MAIWVGISVAAAFLQNLRSSVQKHLTARLSTGGATATRFLYGLPFAALWLALVCLGLETLPPAPTVPFVAFVLTGSLAQIVATTLLLASFSSGSFSAGTTYSKTEGIQAVAFGYAFLGDRVSAGGLVGVVLTVLGVLAVSLSRSAPRTRSGSGPGTVADAVVREPFDEPFDEPSDGASGRTDHEASERKSDAAGYEERGSSTKPHRATRLRGVGLGLSSGALFAVSGVSYRGASLALDEGHFLLRASFTLVVALAVQSVVTATRLALAEPGELSRMRRAWRPGLAVGLAGAGASAGWFTAFTLANAAYVKAVGSVELVFALLSAWLVFRERPSAAELGGVALVMLGVVVTVLVARG